MVSACIVPLEMTSGIDVTRLIFEVLVAPGDLAA